MTLPKTIFPGSHADAGDGDIDFDAWSKLVVNLEYLDETSGIKSIAGVSSPNPTLSDIGATPSSRQISTPSGGGLSGGGTLGTNLSLAIAASGVANAMLAQVPAYTLKANLLGSTANPSDVGLSALIDATFGSAQGGILYRGTSLWSFLSPGTAGQFLATGGANANPSWGTPSGAGNVSTSGAPTAGQLAQFASATSIQGLAGALSVALGGTGSTTGALDLQSAETTIASAATTDIGSATTRRVAISGTTAITSLGTQANRERLIRFTGALTLAYNATSLILPGSASITTVAGDIAFATSDASGNWTVREYQKADGTPIGQGGTFGTSGSFSLSGGLIVKWGSTVITTDAGGNASIAFPAAFPTAAYAVFPLNGDSSSVPQTIISIYTGAALTASSFSIHGQSSGGAVTGTTIRINWIALGK